MSDIQEIKEKEDKTNAERKLLVNSEEFGNRIIQIREEDDNASWSEIARRLSEEFNMNVNSNQIKNKYENEIALEMQISGYAEKQFNKYIGSMSRRYDNLIKVTDRLLQAMDTITEKLAEADPDDMENILQLIQLIKPLHTMNKSVLSQMDFVREEQDKILKKVSLNKKEMSDEDIRQKIYEYLPNILETMEKKGKIEILDKNILNK